MAKKVASIISYVLILLLIIGVIAFVAVYTRGFTSDFATFYVENAEEKIFGASEIIEFFGMDNEFAFVTNKAKEGEINSKLNELINCEGIVSILNTIRIEG